LGWVGMSVVPANPIDGTSAAPPLCRSRSIVSRRRAASM
jgi:hypothetical protein